MKQLNLRSTVCATILLAALAWNDCVAAQINVGGGPSVEPRVTRQQFLELLQSLHLERSYQQMAELLFSDYQREMTSLAQDLDAWTIQAGRKTYEDAVSGKARVPLDELRRLQVEVARVQERAWPIADEALDTLLSNLEVLLTPQQTALFQAGVRELRRQIFLHPRQADAQSPAYAGDGVDILQLVEGGFAETGELTGLSPDSLEAVLSSYEQPLDALLQQIAGKIRASRHEREIAIIQRDSAAIRRAEQVVLEQWSQLYALNSATAERIGQIAAAALGEEAQQRWLHRFDRECFPSLFLRKRADRQIEWLRQHTLTDEQLAAAETAYKDYLRRRNELSRQAIQIMLRARADFHVMLHPMADLATIGDRVPDSLRQDLLKNSGEITGLEASTSSAFESLLDASQRQAMREAMNRPDPALRRR